MRCRQLRSRIWDYLDGEMAPSRAEEVRQHLQECASCRDYAAAREHSNDRVSALFAAASLETENLPEVAASVISRLQAEERPRPVLTLVLSWRSLAHAAAFAGLFFVLTAALTLYFQALLGCRGPVPELSSQRQFAFTAKPRHDGTVDSGLTARRYAQIKTDKGWPR